MREEYDEENDVKKMFGSLMHPCNFSIHWISRLGALWSWLAKPLFLLSFVLCVILCARKLNLRISKIGSEKSKSLAVLYPAKKFQLLIQGDNQM